MINQLITQTLVIHTFFFKRRYKKKPRTKEQLGKRPDSGSAALCSGLCYAEWSWRVPVEGSTYSVQRPWTGVIVSMISVGSRTSGR